MKTTITKGGERITFEGKSQKPHSRLGYGDKGSVWSAVAYVVAGRLVVDYKSCERITERIREDAA